MLNLYFGALAGAVMAEGGEVLKFIGDGRLAVFPIEADAASASKSCKSLLMYDLFDDWRFKKTCVSAWRTHWNGPATAEDFLRQRATWQPEWWRYALPPSAPPASAQPERGGRYPSQSKA